MSKEITTLYSFIAKIISLVEEELNELGAKKSTGEIIIKKNIIETLTKLVNLIIQLNKLSKEQYLNDEAIIPEDDQAIITEFLRKYQ